MTDLFDQATLERIAKRTNPPFAHSFWQSHLPSVDLTNFRGQSSYLLQEDHVEPYAEMVEHLRLRDTWGLLETLDEDDVFGAFTYEVDGRTVSRDLLDSIEEIGILRDWLGWDRNQQVNVLDIGAGYGRLAHRLCAAMPAAEVWCVDAIAESTWLCASYLACRGVERACAVAFDDIPRVLENIRFDVATAIHSWSECTTAAVTWWVSLISRLKIPAVLFTGAFVRTNDFGSGGSGIEISTILNSYGYKLDIGLVGNMEHLPFYLYRRQM